MKRRGEDEEKMKREDEKRTKREADKKDLPAHSISSASQNPTSPSHEVMMTNQMSKDRKEPRDRRSGGPTDGGTGTTERGCSGRN